MQAFTLHKFHQTATLSTGCCAAIGFFDGVHRGHQYLIGQIKTEAKKRGLHPIVVSFEEHPRLALSATRYWPEILTTNEEKLRLLSAEGLAACAMLHFDLNMSALTSQEFMETILRDKLNVRCLVVGYDHHFGSDLSAGYREYAKYGKELGMEVIRESPFEENDLRISSSATRRFLTGGNVEMAMACLGRPYLLEGTVVRGRHAGTRLGYPTANLRPGCAEQLVPGRGVYACRATLGGFSYMAMANIGWRPTLDNGHDQTIEAHLLDYTGGDLYGSSLALRFFRRIRDERRFENIETLKKQLTVDAQAVEKYFSK